MHITSLSSKYGIGDLGPEAYKFVDFLRRAGQSYWQILPLNHTTAKTAYSPYNCLSAFAGNPLLISPELLYQIDLLRKTDIQNVPKFPTNRVDYTKVAAYKKNLFQKAFERFGNSKRASDLELFCSSNSYWINDFARFMALRGYFRRRPWSDWPTLIRERNAKAVGSLIRQLKPGTSWHVFLQYVFYQQWHALKKYCNENGIQVIGDVPIYVTWDSPDVWAHQKLFKLTRTGRPKFVAGVPPDCFSRTGQLWGNPVYDWQQMKRTGYRWWVQRIGHNLDLFDLIRLDHFRGFFAYWRIPAGQKTAVRGRWVNGPGEDFFDILSRHFLSASMIAEDLGHITADVKRGIAKFALPCMRVLQFALDGSTRQNPHVPHNHIENCFVYVGTHDNNTIRGWFSKEATREQKKRLFDYLGCRVSPKDIHWKMIRLAMSSVARVAILQMQDVVGLDESARMNRPGRIRGNWQWRLKPGQITPEVTEKLEFVTQTYART
jgi:4-alpha-glucanotransferase